MCLISECDFFGAAIPIFGHMLVKTPGLDERRWFDGLLQGLPIKQIGFFDWNFGSLGIMPSD